MVTNFFNKTLSKPQAAFAGLTAAVAGVRVAIGLWRYAITLAIKPIQMMVRAFLEAADAASRIYAKSLQTGGMPVGYVTKMGNLADIIGVSEHDVIQYGEAVRFLNSQIKTATRGITESIPSLTAMSWEWKVMKLNLHAAEMEIASQFAPVMNIFIQYLRFGSENIAKLAHHLNLLSLIGIPKWVQNILKSVMPNIPPPAVSAKRLEVSQWERQGLVLGNMGGGSHAAQTAKNTAKTVTVLEKMLQRVNANQPNPYWKPVGAASP
jgi:hypothetical protein